MVSGEPDTSVHHQVASMDPPVQDTQKLVVISGPSGVGKGTLCQQLIQSDTSLVWSVSMTSRPPRPVERPGIDYEFVTRDAFMDEVNEGRMLEWAEYNGNLYGTPMRRLEVLNPQTQCLLLEIDVQGALQVKANYPDACLIFIAPPSIETLSERLRKRGLNDEDDIQRRVTIAETEMTHRAEFNYIVVNDTLELAFSELRHLIEVYRQ